jgi:hypothetical protein
LVVLPIFGIGNTTEVFHFPENSELTKKWLKIRVSTGRNIDKRNFINDKFYKPINTSGLQPDGHNSVTDLTLTYRGKRELMNTPAPFSKGLVKK